MQVVTGKSYTNAKIPIIPDGVPFVHGDLVTVLKDVGERVAERLLRIPEYCEQFQQERSHSVPEGICLPQAVRTGQALFYGFQIGLLTPANPHT